MLVEEMPLRDLAPQGTYRRAAQTQSRWRLVMFETMILGAGPGGTGPLAWAAASGALGAWLDRGVAIVDRQDAMGGTVGCYALNADTLGGTFLECLNGPDPEPALVALHDDPAARALKAYRGALPPLALVGRFLARLGEMLAAEVERHARSCFLAGMHVLGLRLCRDGSVAAELMDRQGHLHWLRAASAVVALGGHQSAGWQAPELHPGIWLNRWRHQIVPSDCLLAAGGTTPVAARLAHCRQPQAVILGGSHSALSAAWTLLERMPEVSFERAGLHILYRNAPRVFYPSRADAADDGYGFSEADVCPATGRVHRLGGLRGDGRALWRRMHGLGEAGAEERVVAVPLASLDAQALHGLLDAADLIVPALGYRLTTVPVYAADGRRIPLARSGAAVDADAHLRVQGGGALPNVFGIGLGSGFRPWGKMAGEPGFHGQQNSLWLYQHGLGALIHDGVRRWAAQRRERAGELALRRALELAALCLPPGARVPGIT